MKTYNHPLVINLVNELLDRIPETKKGTYNQMDPTQFIKGELEVCNTKVEFNDCTWGIEILINDNKGFNADLYLDWQDQTLSVRKAPKGTFKKINTIVKTIKENNLFPSKNEEELKKLQRLADDYCTGEYNDDDYRDIPPC